MFIKCKYLLTFSSVNGECFCKAERMKIFCSQMKEKQNEKLQRLKIDNLMTVNVHKFKL